LISVEIKVSNQDNAANDESLKNVDINYINNDGTVTADAVMHLFD